MEYFLLLAGFFCMLFGIVGSLLPALPGLPVSWLGLLLLYFIPEIPVNYWVLGITLLVVVVISILDYIIPGKGTKYFGGSKYGIWGTNIGLVIGLFFPPLGFVIGPFLGALVGELMYANDGNRALKAAFGSFLGLLASTFIKVMLSLVLLFVFLFVFIANWKVWF
jgi:uncharacterized protein